MGAKLIEGKQVADQIRKDLTVRIAELQKKGVTPGLAVIMVGDDPASASYVRMKGKACLDLGLHSLTLHKPADLSEKELLRLIAELNVDPQVNGILVQMPVPGHIDVSKVVQAIDPDKDVDAFHPVNVGKMLIGEGDGFLPATPHGIQVMLNSYGYHTAGKHVVIVGRSNIVGKPMAAILMQKGEGADATVTVCHSHTKDLKGITSQADILISAIGKANFIKADMVKEGAVVIDVGSNRIDDQSFSKGYRFVGDVDFEAVKEKAAAITPVPGGVGPMTIVMLMHNTVLAAERALERTQQPKV
ncbi:MAG: bifunctional methylenetetrahydrofolate dehydrogenase/methenyltetrahydrofolate cyclohydrolase FolD [Methanomassiliicoccales archaeon]|nr:bifunctional methylenetetrahydrofolate dehydrogenase/methenyltetrahydrofolate cyclohydrolase FolD [Methanomassiliicoccales archaeon]